MWSIKRRTCFNEGRVSSKNNHRIAVDVGYCSSVGLCIVQAADFFDAYLLAPGLLLHKLLGAVIRSRPVSAVNSVRSNQPGLVRIIVTRFVEALNCTHVSRSSTLWPNDVAYHALHRRCLARIYIERKIYRSTLCDSLSYKFIADDNSAPKLNLRLITQQACIIIIIMRISYYLHGGVPRGRGYICTFYQT